jgi:radical SAM enzyme (TIGR01210 family)
MVMKKIRNKRPSLSIDEIFYQRKEQSRAGVSCTLWFMTVGCSWDKDGGCTMCNHGCGHSVNEENTINAIKQGLASFPSDMAELFLLVSGSFFDPHEVSQTAKKSIYNLLNMYPFEYLGLETRSESVTESELVLLKNTIKNKKIGIEIGLESSDPWIREFCINKGNTLDDFVVAANLIRKYDFECLANVSLGNAFLTFDETLKDTVQSAKWALQNGADTVVLFPVHVKPYTLLEWLYKNGYYNPPTLWQFIEALYSIGSEMIGHIDISWYRSGYTDTKKILSSPDSCVSCRNIIYDILDQFRIKRDFYIVEKMMELNCQCKNTLVVDDSNMTDLKERVVSIYNEIAYDFGLSDWYDKRIDEIKKRMDDVICSI